MKSKRSSGSLILSALIVIVAVVTYIFFPSAYSDLFGSGGSTPAPITPTPAVLSENVAPSVSIGHPSKTTDCKSDGVLPDPGCTPGAIDLSVTQDNIGSTICVSGYSGTVRPPTSLTNKIKELTLAAYSFTGAMSDYELDHLISLELGGCPDCVPNLWPEPYNNTMGAHQKDKVENYLHKEVCNGQITLDEAQKEIATDWTAVYHRVYGQ